MRMVFMGGGPTDISKLPLHELAADHTASSSRPASPSSAFFNLQAEGYR